LSANKRKKHEQTETGNNRQRAITSERHRSGLSGSANTSGVRNNTQKPAETRSPPQKARTTGNFARDSAETRSFVHGHAFSAIFVQKSPVFANVRLRPKTPDVAGVGRKSSVFARGRLSPTDIVESGQTSPSKRQQQVSSGKRRKRLGGGIRLFVVQNAGGLAQAGRKGEPAVPVALSRRVFA
jgi:hypothetical protein